MLQFNTEMLQKIVKFGVVGLLGMAVDFVITYLCKEKIGLNKYLSNSIGFSLAVISNFYFNFCWTFNASHNNITAYMELFIGIAMVGLLLNNLLIYVFTDVEMNFYLTKCIAIVIVFA